jgi:hypothetical protein
MEKLTSQRVVPLMRIGAAGLTALQAPRAPKYKIKSLWLSASDYQVKAAS